MRQTRRHHVYHRFEPESIQLVIVKQHLVQIGQMDGPTEYLSLILAEVKSRMGARHAAITCTTASNLNLGVSFGGKFVGVSFGGEFWSEFIG